jgi:hypothetical protein
MWPMTRLLGNQPAREVAALERADYTSNMPRSRNTGTLIAVRMNIKYCRFTHTLLATHRPVLCLLILSSDPTNINNCTVSVPDSFLKV